MPINTDSDRANLAEPPTLPINIAIDPADFTPTALQQLTTNTGIEPQLKAAAAAAASIDFLLLLENAKLTLRHFNGNAKPVDVYVDFSSAESLHRLQYGGGAGQSVCRAVGVRRGQLPSICDATAGLGKDAFTLASVGCEVCMFEQSAVIHALLDDGLQRALACPKVSPIASRMRLHNACSLDAIRAQTIAPAVIYLDPMYPPSKKSAAVKKGMRALQVLLHAAAHTNTTVEPEQLLHAAIENATQRVVVKRPASAPALIGGQLSGSVSSKTTRYDIYKPTRA